MDLPAELRNQIYTFALVCDEWIVIRDERATKGQKSRKTSAVTTPTWHEPALLQASEQLRQEASRIYYESNRFYFGIDTRALSDVYAFIRAKSPEERIRMEFMLQIQKSRGAHVVGWLSLAKPFHETAPGLSGPWEVTDMLTFAKNMWYIEIAVMEVANMGVLGGARGLPFCWIESDFCTWLKLKLWCTKLCKIRDTAAILEEMEREGMF